MVFSYRRHVIWLYTNIKLLCADNFFKKCDNYFLYFGKKWHISDSNTKT